MSARVVMLYIYKYYVQLWSCEGRICLETLAACLLYRATDCWVIRPKVKCNFNVLAKILGHVLIEKYHPWEREELAFFPPNILARNISNWFQFRSIIGNCSVPNSRFQQPNNAKLAREIQLLHFFPWWLINLNHSVVIMMFYHAFETKHLNIYLYIFILN